MDDLIYGVVAGDPLVNISDNINTHVTQQALGLDILGESSLADSSDSEKSEDLEHDDDEVCEVFENDLTDLLN